VIGDGLVDFAVLWMVVSMIVWGREKKGIGAGNNVLLPSDWPWRTKMINRGLVMMFQM
jgi:hypothetical protein